MSDAALSPPPSGATRSGPGFVISRSRRVKNQLLWSLCGLALVLLVIPVVWILAGVITNAVSGWHWSVLTQDSTGTGGGLLNTIIGTLVITFGVGILAGVVGIGAGIYLAEFCPAGTFGTVLRSASEILSGIPSIVFGYCGYLALVIGLHWGYSLLAALIVVAMLVVPYVAKSTELALSQVPLAYREGAEGLGMARPYILRKIVLRAAIPGMATGVIVALAISVGETAPLIYTASFNNQNWNGTFLHNPVGYLTYAVYSFYDEPGGAAQQLAHDAALILLVLVLLLIVSSRLVVRLTQKYSPERVTNAPSTRADRRAVRERSAGR